MEHVVFFPAQDGSPAFRRLDGLDEALRFVEHLRNTEGVTEFSVHTLAPVNVTVRAYYRVEVPAEAAVEPVGFGEPVPTPVEEPGPGVDPDLADLVPVMAGPMDMVDSVDGEPVAAAAPERNAVAASNGDLPGDTPGGSSGRRGLGFFAR